MVASVPPLVASVPPLVASVPPLVASVPPLVASLPTSVGSDASAGGCARDSAGPSRFYPTRTSGAVARVLIGTLRLARPGPTMRPMGEPDVGKLISVREAIDVIDRTEVR